MRTVFHAVCAAALLAAGCGPSVGHRTTMPTFPRESSLQTAGHRCAGATCTCRPLGGGDQEETQPPAPGTKRYEVRIPVTLHPVWVHVDDIGTFYKDALRGDETCVYFDLPPGEHPLTYKIEERSAGEGFAAILRVSEYGAKTHAWYEVFLVDCGVASGKCTKAGLEDWVAATKKIPRQVVDPCSSTRFKQVTWSADEHEGPELRNLAVGVTLKAYKFTPSRPPGSRCEGGTAREPAPAPPAPTE